MVDRTKKILEGAIATTRGWVNPKTGELLVSIRGLPNAVAWKKGMKFETQEAELKEEEPKDDALAKAMELAEAVRAEGPEVEKVLEAILEEDNEKTSKKGGKKNNTPKKSNKKAE